MLDEGAVLVDIRTSEEWQKTGVIKSSKLITAFDKSGNLTQKFLSSFTNFQKDTSISLICRSGVRTKIISEFLSNKLGYKNIHNVEGGIVDWIKQQNPVIKN